MGHRQTASVSPPLLQLLVATVVLSSTAGLAANSVARAQTRLEQGGMDLHLFRPAVDSRGLISVNGGDTLARNDFSFGLMLDGGFKLLPTRGFTNDPSRPADQAETTKHIVNQMITGTLMFNFGVLDYLQLGAQLPIALINGKNVSVPGYYNDAASGNLSYQGLGDIGVYAKVRLLPIRPSRFRLAAIVNALIPTGKESKFAGDPGFSLWSMLAFEYLPVDIVRLAVNAGYRWNTGEGASYPVGGRTSPDPTSTAATNALLVDAGSLLRYGDLITFGTGIGVRFIPTVEFVAELYGGQIAGEIGRKGATSMEALGGFKIFVQKHSFLTLALGGGFPHNSMQAANWRAVVGFMFEPPLRDRDRDGIRDNVDKCPDQPEDLDKFQDADGCPDLDNDRDGIPDSRDECPLLSENRDGVEDEDGCPESIPDDSDSDGDGIPDTEDRCPDEAEDIDGAQDEDGCPDTDNDGDGVVDTDDLCPRQAEDFDNFEDQDGCPDPDNDRDRILDIDDRCPDQAETYNGSQDKDGCPDKGRVVVEDNQLIILERVYFQTDSADIDPRSFTLLDAVAETLLGNPQIALLEVQGHADNRGSAMHNLRLTKTRAEAVVQALVKRGVESNRVRSAGYGELCPIETGDTPQAWDKNRRVEFKIVATADGATNEEIVCPAGRKLMPK